MMWGIRGKWGEVGERKGDMRGSWSREVDEGGNDLGVLELIGRNCVVVGKEEGRMIRCWRRVSMNVGKGIEDVVEIMGVEECNGIVRCN